MRYVIEWDIMLFGWRDKIFQWMFQWGPTFGQDIPSNYCLEWMYLRVLYWTDEARRQSEFTTSQRCGCKQAWKEYLYGISWVPSREAIMLGISGEYATISLSFENILVPSANFSLEPSIEFGPHHTWILFPELRMHSQDFFLLSSAEVAREGPTLLTYCQPFDAALPWWTLVVASSDMYSSDSMSQVQSISQNNSRVKRGKLA